MFEKVLVKSPKRSRLDFSHGNTLSMEFGKLTPTELRFIVPDDEVTVSMEQIIRVAPLPVPTFVNMKVRHDWFYVPLSMMYDQFALDNLFGNSPSSYHRACYRNLEDYVSSLSQCRPSAYQEGTEPFVAGSIHDYFNLPVFTDVNCDGISDYAAFVANPNSTTYNNLISALTVPLTALPGPIIEPMLAYHYIWRDWYRFTGFNDNVDTYGPWLENHIFGNEFTTSTITAGDDFGSFYVGSEKFHGSSSDFYPYISRMYVAHLKKDMFTSARAGTKPQVLIPTGGTGTIPNLRTASALQKFIDIVSVAGQRYWDKVKALFNVTPSGMKCERAQFLGRYMSYIKVGEVITTATTEDANTGDYAGRGILVDGKYIFKRRFTEHGWLMCISSIIPEMAYSGYDRQLTDINILDTPIPQLANVGDQSIIFRELRVDYGNSASTNNTAFGDQFRYYSYKSDINRIHGDFLMDSFSPWTAVFDKNHYLSNDPRVFSRVIPRFWNKIFDDATSGVSYFFNGRFFVDLTFHEFITRSLPKYVSYAL